MTATRPCCPHDHKGWDHPLPLDTIPARHGGGWSCPGIRPDGTDCGYELSTAAVERPGGLVRNLYAAAAAVLEDPADDDARGQLRAAHAAFGGPPP